MTSKRAKPSRTIKSGTKNYLLNVFQDPGRIFCSYSKLEKLLAAIKSFVSKEVKEFPKILQRQKVQEINAGIHRTQSAKITFAQSKTSILYNILHPYFYGSSFNDQALF